MVAGTSTGGVIAAAITVPANEYMNETYPAAEILESLLCMYIPVASNNTLR